MPRHFRVLEVDADALESLLLQAPAEGSAAAVPLMVALPYPDGTDQLFRVEESPILEPELAARFPEIRTFVAQGIDDPTATARLSLTSLGFHAMVLSISGTVFIDPYRRWDDRYALSYFKRDAVKPAGEPFRCDTMNESLEENFVEEAFPVAPLASGTELRTYRLALAATGEYSFEMCWSNMNVGCVQNALAVTMNRVNGIYERELAIRMTLVTNNDRIAYLNGATDPYTNRELATMIRENILNIDSVIGAANFDIGHVFGTGRGGFSVRSSACGIHKAGGTTALWSPFGDAFDVDYVAHEMGHQFGAGHTFNGTTGSCGNGNREALTAHEPGSGTTIMGYAGVCDAENIQPHTSDTFHTRSFEQISNRIPRVHCGTRTATNNGAPMVDAGRVYTIPKQTPFTLTGSATDPDGDTLTYMWEEYDLGTASPPSNDVDAERPIFRSFTPLTEPSRTFPQISDVLNNVATLGESLPTRSRTMTFRLTARDNRAGGGGVNWAATKVTVNAAAGPFVVTHPNTPVSWPGLSSQLVFWNVAGTTAVPISCANVAIHLSTDGGNTFPAALAATTPNDGIEWVTLPNGPTSRARIRVSCVGNIFFDISNVDFTLLAAPTLRSIDPTSGDGAGGTFVVLTGTNFVRGATVHFDGVPATSVRWHSVTTLSALTPAHSPGAVNVGVTNPDQLRATLNGAFTYLPPSFLPLPSTVNTGASPSVLSLSGTTYVFYKGPGTDPGIYVTSSRLSIYPGSWTPSRRLPFAINTSAAPSVAERGGNIYVAYKGAGNDTNIYVARSITNTATWTMTRFPVTVNTSTGPEAFFYGNRFYVFYKGSGNDQRMFVEQLSDDAIWTPTTINNPVPGIEDLSRSPEFQLPSTVLSTHTPSTIVAPLGQLDPPSYVFYKSIADDSKIWLITSNGGEIDPKTTWTQKHLPSQISTSDAPSVVTDGRAIYVVYKGSGSNSFIYVARSLDRTATWSMTQFPATVSTSTGPNAFIFDRKLYVFYKGSADERMYVAPLSDNAIWTPLPQPAIP